MNCPARPVGIGPMFRKPRKPFSPKTINISPNRIRAIKVTILITSSELVAIVRLQRGKPVASALIDSYLTHPTQPEIFKRLTNLSLRVHHEWTIARYGLVQ